MKKILWVIFSLAISNFSAAQTKDQIIFQCRSGYENISLNLTATSTKAIAHYTIGDGKSFKCEAVISFFDQSKSQIPTYEANLVFERKCEPKLTSTLARTIAVDMKLIIPISKDEFPTLSWVNYRKGQRCSVEINDLKNYFKMSRQ